MDAMQSGVPQFEHFARLHAFYPQISVPQTPGQKFATDGLHEVAAYIEPSFFRIFDWNWLAGDPLVALSEPKSAVLPHAMAFFTISYQAVKAATANPVNSLRNE